MKSILFFQYAATGEGCHTIIQFCNQSRISDEDAVEKLKSELDPYFHVGIDLYNISTIKDNTRIMRIIKECTPVLFDYINLPEERRRPVLSIKYDGYINYS